MQSSDDAGDLGAFFAKAAELERKGTPFALATIVAVSGSAPRHVGARMIVLSDGSTFDTLGGGGLEKRVTEDALGALASGRSALRTYGLRPEGEGGIGAECGGEAKVFIEVRGDGPRLVVIGGGHVGSAIARSAVPLGFALTVVDAREDFASPGRFPPGTEVVHADPARPETAATIPEGGYVVILTHSHTLDQEALRHMIVRKPRYIGMIGSRRKAAAVLARLREEGVDPEALGTVCTPVGLDIGAETPEEIAL
ncbi:MAG: XdhC family protein, partial [Planctomycetota bacterium]